MKKLVVYYSLSGNTETVARTIAREIKAELCRVEEIKKGNRFLKYITGGFAASRDKCSKIKPLDKEIHDYDFILLGTPIWAGKPVPAINTFINDADFRKKKIIAFFTMGGSEYQKAKENITRKIEQSSGIVGDCFAIKTGRKNHDAIVKETKKMIKMHLKHLS